MQLSDMPVVLVTGSSSGVGKSVVEHLSRFDFRILAGLRNMYERRDLFDYLPEEQRRKIRMISLDVENELNREECVDLLRKDYRGQLYALVNNAGFGLFGALEDCSEKQIRQQLEVNFFAPLLMTRSLLPYLRQRQGRVLNISSGLGRFALPQMSIYAASKFALEGLSEGLYFELRAVGVQMTTLRLGGVKTPFYQHLRWGEKSQQMNGPYTGQTRQVKSLVKTFGQKITLSTPEQIARQVHYLLAKKRLAQSYDLGIDSRALSLIRGVLPQKVWNQLVLSGQNYLENK